MTKSKMSLDDWLPPLGIRATWLKPHTFTDREAVLAAALDNEGTLPLH